MSNKYSIAFDDLRRRFFAERPRDVEGVRNRSALYYRRWMLRKVFAIFELSGVPEAWDLDYFWTHLFIDGGVCITDTDMGVLALQTGWSGINVYNHPTECVIANPVLGSFRRTIGKDCVLLHLQYDYNGIGYLLDRYSYLLAVCDEAISVNLMNSKVAAVFQAETKAQAESIKKAYDSISMGDPMVVLKDSALMSSRGNDIFFNHVKENFIAQDVEILKHMIINDFLTEIGIANSNADKRERVQSAEVDANNSATAVNIIHWKENLENGIYEANDMFGLDLSIKLREEVRAIESSESVRLPSDDAGRRDAAK